MALIFSCQTDAAPHPINAEQNTSADAPAYRVSGSDFTIGSAPRNDWVPTSDASRLGPVQAVVRKQGDAWEMTNLGSLLPVRLNGELLPCRATAVLKAGDVIALGHCRIDVRDDANAQAVAPSPAADNDASQIKSTDAFSDLFGPGTLPLAAPEGGPPVHPFALQGDTHRNAADPLATLTPAEPLRETETPDPMNWFEPLDRHDTPDVFTDHTPSVLDERHRNHSKT